MLTLLNGRTSLALVVEGMRVVVARSPELLMLVMYGVLTLRGASTLRGKLVDQLYEQDARAVVIDMRAAIPMFGRSGWRKLAQPSEGDLIAPPIALVTEPRYNVDAREYCMAQARRGLLRGPFTCLRAAVEWASECREHWDSRPLVSGRFHFQSQPAEPTAHRLDPAPQAEAHPSFWRS
jgi:hypothetical protein